MDLADPFPTTSWSPDCKAIEGFNIKSTNYYPLFVDFSLEKQKSSRKSVSQE